MKALIFLLVLITILAIYGKHVKEQFNGNAVYSSSVIATTGPNTISSPTRLHLNRQQTPSMQVNSSQGVVLQSVQPNMSGVIGLEYTAPSSNVQQIFVKLQQTINASQVVNCPMFESRFQMQKDRILSNIRAGGNITCADLQTIVLQAVATEPINVKMAVASMWDTVAIEICNKVTGQVDVDKLDGMMTSLYKSLCP